MYRFGETKPVLFEIVLIILSFLAAGIFVFAGSIFYLPSEFSSSIGRIAIGLFLIFLYRRAFKENRLFGDIGYLIPALLFAVWNIFYNLSSGMKLGGAAYFVEGVITAMAPAIFEEVIFRGIFLHNLKKKGYKDLFAVLISALVFSLVHLTNIAGLDAATVALQVGYSFVIGLVFAAVYLKNRSIVEVILAHFLIDFSNRIFMESSSSSSTLQVILFVILLVLEAVYALWLTTKKK